MLLGNLHRITQSGTEAFHRNVPGDLDVTVRQTMVMAMLEENDGVSQTAIVNATGIDRSTLADIVRRLTKRGWLTRRRTKEDARAYSVKVTPEGKKALRTALSAMSKTEKDLLARFPALKHLQNGS